MLRRIVLGIGLAMLGAAALLLLSGRGQGGVGGLIVTGALLAGGVAFERFRYKQELDRPPGPGWTRTEEQMVDEEGVVTVWFNPATGERAYVRGKERVLF